MHPEMLSYLVADRHRELAATATRRTRRRPARLAARGAAPRLRVSWSRTTLNATGGGQRGRSVVIVISASRAV